MYMMSLGATVTNPILPSLKNDHTEKDFQSTTHPTHSFSPLNNRPPLKTETPSLFGRIKKCSPLKLVGIVSLLATSTLLACSVASHHQNFDRLPSLMMTGFSDLSSALTGTQTVNQWPSQRSPVGRSSGEEAERIMSIVKNYKTPFRQSLDEQIEEYRDYRRNLPKCEDFSISEAEQIRQQNAYTLAMKKGEIPDNNILPNSENALVAHITDTIDCIEPLKQEFRGIVDSNTTIGCINSNPNQPDLDAAEARAKGVLELRKTMLSNGFKAYNTHLLKNIACSVAEACGERREKGYAMYWDYNKKEIEVILRNKLSLMDGSQRKRTRVASAKEIVQQILNKLDVVSSTSGEEAPIALSIEKTTWKPNNLYKYLTNAEESCKLSVNGVDQNLSTTDCLAVNPV